MQGIKRRVVYIGLFEALAIVCLTVGLKLFSSQSVSEAGVASVIVSAIAITWNLIYNTCFEAWERRQTVKGRSVRRRIAHATGFELGLTVIVVPFFAWWLDVSLMTALLLDIGMVIFFLVYNFLFTWAFDTVFGLPASAQGGAAASQGSTA